jgi:hypothetical protein
MLLTECEREFLAVFVHEATTDPFKGPATEELHRRNIFYSDLSHLLAAYYREDSPMTDRSWSNSASISPACPWPDRDTASQRNQEVEGELQKTADVIVH